MKDKYLSSGDVEYENGKIIPDREAFLNIRKSHPVSDAELTQEKAAHLYRLAQADVLIRIFGPTKE